MASTKTTGTRHTEELTKTLKALFGTDAVVELRTFKDGATFSGYFDDHNELIKHAAKHDERGHDVYITLNVLPGELAYRRYNRIDRIKGREPTTSDKDVKRRRYIFIDADPERISGISSTDEEKKQGRKLILEIRSYLKALGWSSPIVCDSGNGYHLLYPVDLPNDQASLNLVAGVLDALDFKFSDERTKVDTGTKNAARITKFYGTTAKKGDNLPERPHRPSKILQAPDKLTPVSRELLEKVAATKPEEPRRPFRVYPGGTDRKGLFDLDEWITNHNVPVKREGPWKDSGRRWILEECPWHGHTDNAAYIVQQPTGELGAGCHHDSCKGYRWQDLREHFEPGAYNRQDGANDSEGTTRKSASNDSNDSNDSVFQDLVDLPDPEEFPVEALPPTTRQFVREAAASIGCPVDYIGISVLAALSTAIGDTRRIVLKKDWTEGASIFAAIVGGPASKKTPAMNVALKPVRERQLTLKAEYERQKEEYESKLRDYEKIAKNGPVEYSRPKKPTLGRTYADDTTIERLADILNDNPRGIIIAKDELSAWLAAMNQYKQAGKGSDRQFWLSAHTNQPILVDRKSLEDPTMVSRPFVSLIGGIQPEVLPDFGKDRGDGLVDRVVFAYPAPHVGKWSDDEISDESREGYTKTVGSLYRLEHAEDGEGKPFPSRVRMSDEAKTLFVAEYNRLHEELENPGFPQRLRPAWGKLEAYLARFALILAMTRLAELKGRGQTDFEAIASGDMEKAISLLKYFKAHAQRVYTGLYGDSPSDRLAADIRHFLLNRSGKWEGIASELHDQLASDHKPERPEDLSKAVRAIAKRSPLLQWDDLKRTQDRRPFRLTLKNAVSAVSAVMPSQQPDQEEDEMEVGL